MSYLKGLAAYWRDGYDWRVHERELNSYPQSITLTDPRAHGGDPADAFHLVSR